MSGTFNGLYATPTRRAILRAIHEGRGRIYYEPSAKTVWDKNTALRITNRVDEMVRHGWVRALAPDEARGPGESKQLTYYRLTALGVQALGLRSSTEEKSA